MLSHRGPCSVSQRHLPVTRGVTPPPPPNHSRCHTAASSQSLAGSHRRHLLVTHGVTFLIMLMLTLPDMLHRPVLGSGPLLPSTLAVDPWRRILAQQRHSIERGINTRETCSVIPSQDSHQIGRPSAPRYLSSSRSTSKIALSIVDSSMVSTPSLSPGLAVSSSSSSSSEEEDEEEEEEEPLSEEDEDSLSSSLSPLTTSSAGKRGMVRE